MIQVETVIRVRVCAFAPAQSLFSFLFSYGCGCNYFSELGFYQLCMSVFWYREAEIKQLYFLKVERFRLISDLVNKTNANHTNTESTHLAFNKGWTLLGFWRISANNLDTFTRDSDAILTCASKSKYHLRLWKWKWTGLQKVHGMYQLWNTFSLKYVCAVALRISD